LKTLLFYCLEKIVHFIDGYVKRGARRRRALDLLVICLMVLALMLYINHVRRKGNRVAHTLAKFTISYE
jgi:hypothetical protein